MDQQQKQSRYNSIFQTRSMPNDTNGNGLQLIKALKNHHVEARVIDVDYNREGVAVETDYIIELQWNEFKDDDDNSTRNSFNSNSGSDTKNDAQDAKKEEFAPFLISKTYSSFRTLSKSIKKCVKGLLIVEAKNKNNKPSQTSKDLIRFSEILSTLITSEEVTYLGKITMLTVKHLTKQRKKRVNSALDILTGGFPEKEYNINAAIRNVATLIETFFLTDHVISEINDNDDTRRSGGSLTLALPKTPLDMWKGKKGNDYKNVETSLSAPVLLDKKGDGGGGGGGLTPISVKKRSSLLIRTQTERQLMDRDDIVITDKQEKNKNIYDPPTTTTTTSKTSKGKQSFLKTMNDNPIVFTIQCILFLYIFLYLSKYQYTINGDIFIFIMSICFSFGKNISFLFPSLYPTKTITITKTVEIEKKGYDASQKQISSRNNSAILLLRKSMASSTKLKLNHLPVGMNENDMQEIIEEDDDDSDIQSPLLRYPYNAPLGKYYNHWSEPPHGDFNVRGPNYLKDRKKSSSGEYMFPFRGMDLFLTDSCPENIGSNTKVFGGKLRDIPTFIINFRLPWGVCIFYSEIPTKFLPFLKYGDNKNNKETPPSMDNFSPGDRAVCRFLMGDDTYRNKKLKIVPVVIAGPWVVKSIVGGKPAILGKQLPIDYTYQPSDSKNSEYLEADLDIVASAAARRILSVVRSYTQDLTLDLGFVIEGAEDDELPEQMLCACRLHGMDPFNASPLPEMALDGLDFNFG